MAGRENALTRYATEPLGVADICNGKEEPRRELHRNCGDVCRNALKCVGVAWIGNDWQWHCVDKMCCGTALIREALEMHRTEKELIGKARLRISNDKTATKRPEKEKH